MRFSPGTGIFYADEIAYPPGAVPADAVVVSQADFATAMARAPGEGLALVKGCIVITPAPKITAAQKRAAIEAELRIARNRLLLDSDYTQLPDAPLNAEQKSAWASYRQALRDIDFGKPVWPDAPDPQ